MRRLKFFQEFRIHAINTLLFTGVPDNVTVNEDVFVAVFLAGPRTRIIAIFLKPPTHQKETHFCLRDMGFFYALIFHQTYLATIKY
jgi:hypothetical protein